MVRVRCPPIRVETKNAAIQPKSRYPSNPWRTNSDGRLSNPERTLVVSHGRGRWKITVDVSRFARRFRGSR